MKHLKKFYENTEEDFQLYGIKPEEVKDMFYDIQDEGWTIRVNFSKKLFQHKYSDIFNKDDVQLGLRPYIEVRIKRLLERATTRERLEKEMTELTHSDLFKETISVANDRLKTYGWEMKDIKKDYDYISISIYKINI